MKRLWSTPPQTFRAVRPASLATSTKVTAEVDCADGLGRLMAAATDSGAGGLHGSTVPLLAPRTMERCQFQSGVARASSRVPPRRTNEEPRKRRRGEFIC